MRNEASSRLAPRPGRWDWGEGTAEPEPPTPHPQGEPGVGLQPGRVSARMGRGGRWRGDLRGPGSFLSGGGANGLWVTRHRRPVRSGRWGRPSSWASSQAAPLPSRCAAQALRSRCLPDVTALCWVSPPLGVPRVSVLITSSGALLSGAPHDSGALAHRASPLGWQMPPS